MAVVTLTILVDAQTGSHSVGRPSIDVFTVDVNGMLEKKKHFYGVNILTELSSATKPVD